MTHSTMSPLPPVAAIPVGQLELADLRPFISLLLLQSPEEQASDELFRRVVHGCAELAREDTDRKRRRIGAEPKYETVGAIHAGAIVIEELTMPAWTNNPAIVDVRHHIVVVMRFGNVFALHSSDPGIRRKLSTNTGNHAVPGFGVLEHVPQGIMNAAFVQGVTRTVWLRGIHHPTSLKSDTKMLSGVDLGDAIDPLADQTYHFTAVRCGFDDGESDITIGVAPADSRVWTSRAGNWEAFKAAAIVVLTRLSETQEPSYSPIRFLAIPGAGGRPVEQAFDMGFYPSELMDVHGGEDLHREDRERIATEIAFEVTPQHGPNLTAVVLRRGVRIGIASLHFDIAEEHVVCNADIRADDPREDEDVRRIQRYCEDRETLVVRYDSEHVISSHPKTRRNRAGELRRAPVPEALGRAESVLQG